MGHSGGCRLFASALIALVFPSPGLHAQKPREVVFSARFAVAGEEARLVLAARREPMRRASSQLESLDRGDATRVHLLERGDEPRAAIEDLIRLGSLDSLNVVELRSPPGTEALWLVGGQAPIPFQRTDVVALEPPDSLLGAPPPPLETAEPRPLRRDFGLRLGLLGVPLDESTIRVRVRTVVRSVDFSRSRAADGRLEPTLETRRTNYFLDVEDGQSFAISGALDDRILRQLTRVPELAESKLLASIRNRLAARSGSSLILIVTPRFADAEAVSK